MFVSVLICACIFPFLCCVYLYVGVCLLLVSVSVFISVLVCVSVLLYLCLCLLIVFLCVILCMLECVCLFVCIFHYIHLYVFCILQKHLLFTFDFVPYFLVSQSHACSIKKSLTFVNKNIHTFFN